MSNIEIALKSMGYRQPDRTRTERWCKPFGFTIINCDVESDRAIFAQWMVGTPSKPKLLCWSKTDIVTTDETAESLVFKICYFETYNTKEGAAPVCRSFAFLTKIEEIESYI